MERRFVLIVAVLALLLGGATQARAMDIRGYLQTGSYATRVDSVIFADTLGTPATYVTHNWGGTPEVEDSFNFTHFMMWPRTALLFVGLGTDTTLYTTYLRNLVEDTWYTVNVHPAWDEPQVMFTTHPHTFVDESPAARTRGLSLAPVRPNPFPACATISFANDAPRRIELVVLNAAGARVRTLASGRFAAGTHSLNWNAGDERDHPVPDGVYFCRLTDGRVTLMRKLVLQR